MPEIWRVNYVQNTDDQKREISTDNKEEYGLSLSTLTALEES